MNAVWALGLMTGTVLDGMVDVALIKTDGEQVLEFGPWELIPYDNGIRPLLQRTLESALAWQFEGCEPALFAEAERRLTIGQAEAVKRFLKSNRIERSEIGVIGFHGQTVLHRPPSEGVPGQTRQLGDGDLLAAETEVGVVWDFRTADMQSGGHGAPLSAVYHRALLRTAPPLTTILNLGGVGNLTWAPDDHRIAAFDTGPANAPINDWVERTTGASMDRDGALASRGRVDEERLHAALQHPYLSSPFPKSLDRYAFGASLADGMSLEDGAAFLTAFAASCVGRGLDLLPERPRQIAVCGGGRRNPALIEALRQRAHVEPFDGDDYGWRADALEAECFAFLAVRRLRGLASSFPMTTGVADPTLCGRVARSPA